MLRHRVSASFCNTPRYAGACPRGGKKTAKREKAAAFAQDSSSPSWWVLSYLGTTRVAVEARMAQADGCD